MKLDEVQRDAAFRVHPYEHTVMGFLADVEDMPNPFEYSKEDRRIRARRLGVRPEAVRVTKAAEAFRR